MKRIILFGLIICASCTKELPFPEVDSPKRMVVNSLIAPERGATLHVSESCHVTEVNCKAKNMEKAQVFLLDGAGNTLVEMQHEGEGLYRAQEYSIEYDRTYRVEVAAQGFEKVSSVVKTPQSFACDLTGHDEKIFNEYICWSFELEIEDNPNEENYYLIDGWVDILNGSHEYIEHEINGFDIPHVGFLTNDVNADNKTLVSTLDIKPYPLDYIFLTDKNIQGSSYTIEFGLFEEDTRFDKNYELVANINVKSVSKEMYEYYLSVIKFKLTSNNILAEPEQILSNVQGGIGIVGGYSEHTFQVELPQSQFYLPEGFTVENDGCVGPCTVRFSADIGDKIRFVWDFGDGETSTEKDPEHQYTSPGIYEVKLLISIGDDTHVYSKEIEIR